ncbi:hypothetical protein D6833_06305 [Candidatus Parcubacteria bacterium]|nr:MAG: hypothetical protein D6833_06305 [Candidatus Parcubacteria bacterium]
MNVDAFSVRASRVWECDSGRGAAADSPPGDTVFALVGTTEHASYTTLAQVSTPTNYVTVQVRYKTFIACDVIFSPAGLPFFEGDNRGFGYDLSPSRTIQTFSVTANPSYPTGEIGSQIQGFGFTRGYENLFGTDVTLCTPAFPICPTFCRYCLAATATPECIDQADSGLTITYASPRPAPTTVQVRIDVAGKNPCVLLAPPIDAHITLQFRQTCQAGQLGPPEWRVLSGSWHDAFPWQEMYINRTAVYLWDPCAPGRTPDPLDLFSGRGDILLIDGPSPSAINYAEWNPVP